MPSLFLSYRRSDSPDTVKLLYERLQKRLPRWEIFYDHESIPLGEEFPERLRAKVASAAVVLVIIGPKWLEILQERKNAAVDHVRMEVRLALEATKCVVPILVGHAVMPTGADLADFADLQPLAQRNGRPVRPDPDFDADLEPIVAHIKQLDSNEAIGATLADKYTLTAEIGHGGMGVVYRAEQKHPVKRTVAVKLIKPGMDTRDVLARFDAERQALAVMDHPNIAKVYDAGETAQGRPFFVMEYVKGAPPPSITQYCDEKKLTPQERLNLFIPVCNAVQHAHQKGIIHRDLKPSNVLVEVIDGKPVPKVIDFGLAKALGHKLTDLTLYTDVSMRVGTLEYSAPEQADGRPFDVDTRSDIYSLGVLLYELLTGAPPFTRAELLRIGEKEMCRVISEDAPTTPSKKLSSSGELPSIAANRQLEPNKLTRLVRGDLDWIVMKCLEKENKQRYETANELGQELQRFLADEPVQAGPPTAAYRMKKFLRRNKGPVLAAALLLFALIAGIIGTSIGLLQAEQARKDAVEAGGREQKEREKAVQAFEDLDKSRKEADVVWKVVDQAYSSVNDDNIRHIPGLSPVHEELAVIRLEGMRQLAKTTLDDPKVEPKVARAHEILGLISSYVGSFQRSRENLEKAAEMYGRLAKKHPDKLEYRLQECRAMFDLGWLYWDDFQKPAARRWTEQALERLEREYTRSPHDPEVCYEIGRCLTQLGGCLPDDATKETREKLATRAIRLFEQLIEKKYREADSRAGLAVSTYRLTKARFSGMNVLAQLMSFNPISDLDKAAQKLKPESPYLNSFAIFMHLDRADPLVRMGGSKLALTELEDAVAKSRAIVKRSPDVGRYAELLAQTLQGLARDLQRLERAEDARTAFEECNQIMDGLVDRFPDRAYLAYRWLYCRFELADFLEYGPKAQGEIQARQDLLRTLDQAVQRGRGLASRFPDYHLIQGYFAKSLASRGRYDSDAERNEKALPYLLEAVDVYRTRLLPEKDPPDAEYVTTYLNQVGTAISCAASCGKRDEVARLTQKALQLRKHCTSRDGVNDLGIILAQTAKFHREAGRNAEAIRSYQQAIEVRRTAFEQAPWHWYLRHNIGNSYKELAETYRQTGDFRNEILANREYLKIAIGPEYGAKIEKDIDPSRPTDEAEAKRIRDVIMQATSSGMKRFTIPCEVNGITYPIPFYVTNVPWPKHPLEDQARWLKERNGGVVPKATMKIFGRLHKIAHENDVSYLDLCVHYLGAPSSAKENSLDLKPLDESNTLVGTAEIPGKGVRDPFAALKSRLVELKAKLDNAPRDIGLAQEAAKMYDELGQRQLKAKQTREGVKALQESVRLRELEAREQPTATQLRQLLAATFLLLGQAHVRLKEFDAAYNCFQRRLELLEQVGSSAPSPEQRALIAGSMVSLGELAELRGDRSEALRWYMRSFQEKNGEAASKIANLLQLDAKLAAWLTKDLQAVYARLNGENKPANPMTFVADFTREVEAVQKAKENLAALGSEIGLDQKTRIRWLADFADSYHTLAAEHLQQSKRQEALKAYLREVDLRHLLVRLDSADRQAADNYARALFATAKVHIELGHTSKGIKLLEKGRQLGDENAVFFLADLYTQGKGVAKAPEKAIAMRSEFILDKGVRLFNQKMYDQALSEFERSLKEKPSINGYQLVGFSQRKLGRNEQSLAAFKKGIELASGLNSCQKVVLDLVETALSANKPEEVFAVLRMLDEKKWSAEGTDTPFTFERELTGMWAIALHMAGKDASKAEKKLDEIVSRPNLTSLRSRNLELDAWLKGSRPSEIRQASVRKIVAKLDAPVRELDSPYFPLERGRTWVYTSSSGKEITVLKAARPEQVGERRCWLLETMINGKVAEAEQIAIKLDGVYRQSSSPAQLNSNGRILPFPPQEGDSWDVKSPKSMPVGVTSKGTTRLEDVTVPAGKFEGAIVSEIITQDSGGKSTQLVWYAKDVGPVKIVTKAKNGTLTWELKKVLTIEHQFDKSGKIKTPTAAELQATDESVTIVAFRSGHLMDGRPYWAYILCKPSKYREFHKLSAEGKFLRIGDYGKVVLAGFDKEVPAWAKQKMKEEYAFDENYEEKLAKKAEEDRTLFQEQQEAKRIAEIVEMLKKKQGR